MDQVAAHAAEAAHAARVAVWFTGLSLAVSIAAALVSLRQWKVAKNKLKLDLFQYRYALFELLAAHLDELSRDKGTRQPDVLSALPKFYFLFDHDIGDFAQRVHNCGLQHMIELQTLKQPMSEKVTLASTAVNTHYQWFYDEIKGMRQRFAKYLDFKGWA